MPFLGIRRIVLLPAPLPSHLSFSYTHTHTHAHHITLTRLLYLKKRSGKLIHKISSVQSLSHVPLFATPWAAALQASLCITSSQSLLKLMSIESVMTSNHLILCHPLLLPPSVFPSIRVFSNQSIFTSGGQSIRVSASASVLPMNTQD